MSDSQNGGFGKFVPGFEFLQNLAKSASQTVPQMPNMANWIAPTLSVEDLEKRIDELKAVHFWLDQNSKALAATIQALEVQKMTLATLKGMNFNLGDIANAFKLKAADTVYSGVQKVTEKAASTAESVADAARQTEEIAKKVGDVAKPAAAAAMDMGKNLAKEMAKGVSKEATKQIAAVAEPKAAAAKKAAAKTASKTATKAVAKKPAVKTAPRGR